MKNCLEIVLADVADDTSHAANQLDHLHKVLDRAGDALDIAFKNFDQSGFDTFDKELTVNFQNELIRLSQLTTTMRLNLNERNLQAIIDTIDILDDGASATTKEAYRTLTKKVLDGNRVGSERLQSKVIDALAAFKGSFNKNDNTTNLTKYQLLKELGYYQQFNVIGCDKTDKKNAHLIPVLKQIFETQEALDKKIDAIQKKFALVRREVVIERVARQGCEEYLKSQGTDVLGYFTPPNKNFVGVPMIPTRPPMPHLFEGIGENIVDTCLHLHDHYGIECISVKKEADAQIFSFITNSAIYRVNTDNYGSDFVSNEFKVSVDTSGYVEVTIVKSSNHDELQELYAANYLNELENEDRTMANDIARVVSSINGKNLTALFLSRYLKAVREDDSLCVNPLGDPVVKEYSLLSNKVLSKVEVANNIMLSNDTQSMRGQYRETLSPI